MPSFRKPLSFWATLLLKWSLIAEVWLLLYVLGWKDVETLAAQKQEVPQLTDLCSWWIFSTPTTRGEEHIRFAILAAFPVVSWWLIDRWSCADENWWDTSAAAGVALGWGGCGPGPPRARDPLGQPLPGSRRSSARVSASAPLVSGTLRSGACYLINQRHFNF